MPDAPQVSVVVPLTTGPTQALRCFQAIAAQPDEPPFEVIVVDNATSGLEPVFASLAGDVALIRSERRVSFAHAARLGAGQARGDITVLIREGAEPAPRWLLPLASALTDSSVGLATSTTTGARPTHPVAALSAAIRSSDLQDVALPDVPDNLAIADLALHISQHGKRVVPVGTSMISAPGGRTAGTRRALGEAPEVTIVIPTLDAVSERVRGCVAAVQRATDTPHEIVIIDNGSPPQGFTAPVNAGLRAANAPYVVVMNDDVEPQSGWWPPLRTALDAGATVVFPMTIDGPTRRDFAAWCFAMARETINEISHAPGEFFDPSLVVWYQDTDLLHRLRGIGRPPVLVESSLIRHGLSETVASEDPTLSEWIRAQIEADRKHFLRKHPDARLLGVNLGSA